MKRELWAIPVYPQITDYGLTCLSTDYADFTDYGLTCLSTDYADFTDYGITCVICGQEVDNLLF
jgi:hypothetical protein